MKRSRCIVVGAGIAGIAASIEAALQGMEVIVLESRGYIGGRARSFREPLTGDEIDNGQHVLMGCYRNLRYVLQVLGTESLARQVKPTPIHFASVDGERVLFDPYHLEGRYGVLLGIMRMKNFTLSERVCLLTGALLAISTKNTSNKTAEELLIQCHQTARLRERFWSPLVLATLNAPLEFADAGLLQIVLRRALFGGADSHHLWVPQVGLSRLWEPFEQWLRRQGGILQLSTNVTNLVRFNDHIIGVTTSDGAEIRGNSVIITIPPRALVRLLPMEYNEIRQYLSGLGTMPIVSVYLWLDREAELPPIVGLLQTTSQWVFNRDVLVNRPCQSRNHYPGHLEVTISAAHQLIWRPALDIVSVVWNELQTIFPQLRQAHLTHWRVIKEKQATCLLTPKATRQRLNIRTNVEGLFLAGDWTNTGLPATLESAAWSGIEAARAASQL